MLGGPRGYRWDIHGVREEKSLMMGTGDNLNHKASSGKIPATTVLPHRYTHKRFNLIQIIKRFWGVGQVAGEFIWVFYDWFVTF
jgi:hypothetical protein